MIAAHGPGAAHNSTDIGGALKETPVPDWERRRGPGYQSTWTVAAGRRLRGRADAGVQGVPDREPKRGVERIDAEEFVARVLVQIPDPRRHLVRYYGAYSNRLLRSGQP